MPAIAPAPAPAVPCSPVVLTSLAATIASILTPAHPCSRNPASTKIRQPLLPPVVTVASTDASAKAPLAYPHFAPARSLAHACPARRLLLLTCGCCPSTARHTRASPH
ncbi:hypothetical protein FRC08_002325 [Ceratobasidium sp. 394]|nr:hypothetical protein FRC08_002325 [Ceratobasidium sp. 394]